MRTLRSEIEWEARDAGDWTNAGCEECRALLPPLSPVTTAPFVIYGIEPHPIAIEAIEAGSILLDGQSVDDINISGEQAPGSLIVIRNVLGRKWHATVTVPNLGEE